MDDDLDNLRPKVQEAVAGADAAFNHDGLFAEPYWHTIRAELLRLAADNCGMHKALCEHDELCEQLTAMRLRTEKNEAELAESRETIKRLNRRVQVAEAGVAEKVKASAPGSLGRALANAAASKNESELAALKARIAEAPVVVMSGHRICADSPEELAMLGAAWICGVQRVRLIVEE